MVCGFWQSVPSRQASRAWLLCKREQLTIVKPLALWNQPAIDACYSCLAAYLILQAAVAFGPFSQSRTSSLLHHVSIQNECVSPHLCSKHSWRQYLPGWVRTLAIQSIRRAGQPKTYRSQFCDQQVTWSC